MKFLTALLGLFLLAGCVELPETGSPCAESDLNVCESPSGPGIYTCGEDGTWEYLDCATVCGDNPFVECTEAFGDFGCLCDAR